MQLGRAEAPQEPLAGTWDTDQRCVVQPQTKPWQFFAKKNRDVDSGTRREQSTVGWLEHGERVLLGAEGRWLQMERVGLGRDAHGAGRCYSASIRGLLLALRHRRQHEGWASLGKGCRWEVG